MSYILNVSLLKLKVAGVSDTRCPACGTCNTDLKGTQPIGTNAREMKKLGPTSKQLLCLQSETPIDQ